MAQSLRYTNDDILLWAFGLNMDEFKNVDLHGIRGLLIDIDDTLYDYKSAHNATIGKMYRIFANDFPGRMTEAEFKETYCRFRTEVTNRLENQGACRSRLFAFQALFEALDLPQPYVSAKIYEDGYWSTLVENMVPYSEFISWLSDRKAEGFGICAVTDMQARIQIDKISALGLTSVIDGLVTSEEVGQEKPHPEMFATALRKLDIKAGHAVMFGDNRRKDIEGAEAMGIRACLITKYL